MLHLDCTCTNDLCQFNCFELFRTVSTECEKSFRCWMIVTHVEYFLKFVEKLKLLHIVLIYFEYKNTIVEMLKNMIILFEIIVETFITTVANILKCWKQSKIFQNQSENVYWNVHQKNNILAIKITWEDVHVLFPPNLLHPKLELNFFWIS